MDRELQFHLVAFWFLAVLGAPVCRILFMYAGRWQRLLPLPRRPRRDWSGHEVFLVFVLFLSVVPLVLVILQKTGFYDRIYPQMPSLYRQQLWVWILATPLTIAATFLTLYSVSRTRPPHYGMTTVRLVPNIMTGYLLWLALTPFVLGLFLLVLQWIPAEDHPLALLGRGYLMAAEWVLIIFQAVIAAPLLEELAFRGVLLGWLRRATVAGHVAVAAVALSFAVLAGVPSSRHQDPPAANAVEALDEEEDFRWGPIIFVAALVPLYLGPAFWVAHRKWLDEGDRWQAALPLDLPLTIRSDASAIQADQTAVAASPQEGLPASSEKITTEPAAGAPPVPDIAVRERSLVREESKWFRFWEAFAPICGSSLLFAAFHSAVWPSPIPLFFLALGLGWLAQRTGSLVGPIVAHMMFNAVATIVLIMSAVYP